MINDISSLYKSNKIQSESPIDKSVCVDKMRVTAEKTNDIRNSNFVTNSKSEKKAIDDEKIETPTTPKRNVTSKRIETPSPKDTIICREKPIFNDCKPNRPEKSVEIARRKEPAERPDFLRYGDKSDSLRYGSRSTSPLRGNKNGIILNHKGMGLKYI